MKHPKILDRVNNLGFRVFNSGKDYDLNIIGVRSEDHTPNVFNDWLHVCYTVRGIWHEELYQITTDAGLYWLKNGGLKGTAILCHNQQYRGAYILGKHKGKYEALVQQGNQVKVWRDRNMDNLHDYGGEIDEGYFGINIHRAGATRKSIDVDRWSAGCQVFADPKEYEHFINLCKMQIKHTGYDKFSYTLIYGE